MRKSYGQSQVAHRPKWIRPLLVVTSIVVILRLIGVIEIPKGWFVGAVVLEFALAIFELSVFLIVFRHFYQQQRHAGHGKLEAVTRAQVDELQASGLPKRFAKPLSKAMLWEMRAYLALYTFVRRIFRRLGKIFRVS